MIGWRWEDRGGWRVEKWIGKGMGMGLNMGSRVDEKGNCS
jgi:hypothetical protein